ncbi:hypothetical protein H1C71_005902 [Ictidomys tridecemlineatus]|nr:hypothetical protein H1C71_005902 [Ictidomys tridecemlineatus]
MLSGNSLCGHNHLSQNGFLLNGKDVFQRCIFSMAKMYFQTLAEHEKVSGGHWKRGADLLVSNGFVEGVTGVRLWKVATSHVLRVLSQRGTHSHIETVTGGFTALLASRPSLVWTGCVHLGSFDG